MRASPERRPLRQALWALSILWALDAHFGRPAGANGARPARRLRLDGSELSLEYLGLRSLPGRRELCTIEAQNLNSV